MKFKMIHKKRCTNLKLMHLHINSLQKDLSFFRFLVIEIFFFVGGKGTAYKINLQYSFVGILNHDVFFDEKQKDFSP